MSKDIFDIFNETDIESIATLITKLEESSFDFLKLESDEVKIVIGKNGVSESVEVSPVSVKSTNGTRTSVAQQQLVDETPKCTIAVEQKPATTIQKENTQEHAGIEIIQAPTYGLFYAQPAPGEPKYVQVGDNVKVGDTIGLLEIMKVFNAITSNVEGEIIQIHVQDMDLVEPGQPLISVKVK